MYKFINELFVEGYLPNTFATLFIALISKKANPRDNDEHCLICLIVSIYWIISKFLARRVKGVIWGLILANQTTFISNQNMMDGFCVANKVVYFAWRHKISLFLFKVDFGKAFNFDSWGYVFLFSRRWNLEPDKPIGFKLDFFLLLFNFSQWKSNFGFSHWVWSPSRGPVIHIPFHLSYKGYCIYFEECHYSSQFSSFQSLTISLSRSSLICRWYSHFGWGKLGKHLGLQIYSSWFWVGLQVKCEFS